jgi:hypothetical protein
MITRGMTVLRVGSMRMVLTTTLIVAAALIPGVLAITLMGGENSASPNPKPTELHSLPVSYRGEPITWERANFLRKNQPGMVINIDMRTPHHEQVVLLDTEAENTKLLCQQHVQRTGC